MDDANSMDYLPIGERIGIYRRRRGLSQLRLGGLIDRSENWVAKVEKGHMPVDRLSVLVRVADALHVSLADLLRDPSLRSDEQGTDAPGIAELRGSVIQLPFQPSRQPRPLEELTEDLMAAYELWNKAQLTGVVAALPGILADLHAASTEGDSAALTQLVSAYGLTCKTLSRFGQHDMAHLAADRAVALADRSGDPASQALVAFRMSHVLLSVGRLDDAVHVAEVGMSRAQAHMGMDRVRCLVGAMHLPVAIAVARKGDRSGVYEALDEASARTRDGGRVSIPKDLGWITQYGPANIAIHRVSAAVDLGDAGDAIRTAEQVRLDDVSVSRASRHLIDVGLAYSYRRNTDGMLKALLKAEQLAPEQVRYFPLAREIVYGALKRERGHANRKLHALADRVGVI